MFRMQYVTIRHASSGSFAGVDGRLATRVAWSEPTSETVSVTASRLSVLRSSSKANNSPGSVHDEFSVALSVLTNWTPHAAEQRPFGRRSFGGMMQRGSFWKGTIPVTVYRLSLSVEHTLRLTALRHCTEPTAFRVVVESQSGRSCFHGRLKAKPRYRHPCFR